MEVIFFCFVNSLDLICFNLNALKGYKKKIGLDTSKINVRKKISNKKIR